MVVGGSAYPLAAPKTNGGRRQARQHLSEAQLKASTALAAADPFTERVQKGDKALYRARFAGFDKETAEVACRQLKRSHFVRGA